MIEDAALEEQDRIEKLTFEKSLPVNPHDEKFDKLTILPEGMNLATYRQVYQSLKFVVFTPLITWKDENFGSNYLRGEHYRLREGNEKLKAAVQDWVAMGMVLMGKHDLNEGE